MKYLLLFFFAFSPILSTASLEFGLALHDETDEHVWHFHTGRGRVIDFQTRSSDGRWFEYRDAACRLDRNHLECGEEVFFLDLSYLRLFVDDREARLSQQLQDHGYWVAGSAVAASSGLTVAYLGLATPEPVVSKAVAIGAAVEAGVAVLWGAWNGYKMHQVEGRLNALLELFESEILYAQECGHPRKGFLDRLREFDVEIVFPDHGRLIDPRHYFDTLDRENQLFVQTLDYARRSGLSRQDAYELVFLEECGHLTQVTTRNHIGYTAKTDGSAQFFDEWMEVPEDIVQRVIEVSEKIELSSGKPLSLQGFEAQHFENSEERESFLAFLDEIETDLETLAFLGSRSELANLERFRSETERIIIRPRWAARSDGYEYETSDGRKFLTLDAQWKFRSEAWELSLRPFFQREFGIDFESGF